jgi:hypothetical protein
MKSNRSWLGVGLAAVIFGAGCQSSGGSRDMTASFGMMQESPTPGANSGDYPPNKDVALARRAPVSFESHGMFFVAMPGQSVVRREVLKLKPRKPADAEARDYTVLLAVTQKRGELKWVTSPVKRLFESKNVRATDPPVEPAIELMDSGTVVVSGTAPVVAVKKATVASDGTTFIVEAIAGGGWSLAVLKGTNPVLVYMENSVEAVEVLQDQLLVVTEQANAIPLPIPKEGRFASLQAYAIDLLEATGTPMN